jgi:S1-C subfamily serine protease
MYRCALVLLLFLASCNPIPEAAALKLVTIDSSEAGLSLRELPPQTLRSIGLSFGMAVVRAGSLAERAGLKIGDVVYGIDQRKVENLEEFSKLLAQRADGRFRLLVRRGRTDFYVAVDLAAPQRDAPLKAPPSRETLLRT